MATYTITVNDPNALPDEVFDISGVGSFVNGQSKVVELTDEQALVFTVVDEDGNAQIVSSDRVKIEKGGHVPSPEPEVSTAPAGGED